MAPPTPLFEDDGCDALPGVEAGVPGTVDAGVVGTRVSCEGVVVAAVLVCMAVVLVPGGAAEAVAATVGVPVAEVDLSGLEVLPLIASSACKREWSEMGGWRVRKKDDRRE